MYKELSFLDICMYVYVYTLRTVKECQTVFIILTVDQVEILSNAALARNPVDHRCRNWPRKFEIAKSHNLGSQFLNKALATF